MSIDMYLRRSKGQAASVSTMCKQQQQGYQHLQTSILNFIADQQLKSDAYDSAKEFFSSIIIPLIQGGTLLSETIAETNKKFPEQYESDVDSIDLKSEELEKQIQEWNNKIQHLQEMQREVMNSSMDTTAKTFNNLKNSLCIGIYSNAKRELEEKLAKLLAFNASSPMIFAEINSLKSSIQQGVTQANGCWNASTGTFVVPGVKDMSWLQSLTNSFVRLKLDKLEKKVPNWDMSDLLLFGQIASVNPNIKTPPKIVEFLKGQALPTILGITGDVTTNGLEISGKAFISIGESWNNIRNSFGKASKNLKVIGIGNGMVGAAKNLSRGIAVVTIGYGLVDDMNSGLTPGQAISHNGAVMVAGTAGGATVSGIATFVFGVSNPIGWTIIGAAGGGLLIDYAYNSNDNVKDWIDSIGDSIDSWIFVEAE